MTISPDARMSSTVDLSTPILRQTLHSSFTPPVNPATTEATSSSNYRSKTRAERATEPHTVTKPNWALAPPIQRPIFTKEPRPVHFNGNPPAYIIPPSQPPSGLNLVADRRASTNVHPPAPLEERMAATPHKATEAPISKSPALFVHPSRMPLLQSGGASSEAEFSPAEMKGQSTEGSPNKQSTGANTVPVARMRRWGAGATEEETFASGNVDVKGSIGSRVPWVDRDTPPHPSATLDAVPMGSKIVASARIPLQAAIFPTLSKPKTYSVTVESEDEANENRPAPSPSLVSQISYIDNISGQDTNGSTKRISTPASFTPSLVRPPALKKRTVVEHPHEETNPFIDPESTQKSASIAKTRVPLLQRMGVGPKVGPSALAAHQKLFIEEDGRTDDYDYQYANDEAYSEYEEEEYWTPPRARAEKLVIAGPVGREEMVEHIAPVSAPAKRVVRIAEPDLLSQVQPRRHKVVHYQEGEDGGEDGYGLVYEQYPEEESRIGAAANRRFLVSQTEDNTAPRVSVPIQQGSPRRVIGSRVRRVVIQAPPEVGNEDEVVERFRGLSVAGRVQTPGPRRHRVLKAQ